MHTNNKFENDLVASAEICASNFLIYERNFSIWGVDVSDSSDLTFGVSNPRTGLDSFNRKVAIVFGINSMCKGVAGGVRIGSDDKNIQGYKEWAIRQAMGYSRVTQYDTDVTASNPTTSLDQGSVNFATFSPQPY